MTKDITIKLSRLSTINDFSNELKFLLGSPEWHGNSPDAFVDSIFNGNINNIELPFRISIFGIQNVGKKTSDSIKLLADVLKQASIEYSSQYRLEIIFH